MKAFLYAWFAITAMCVSQCSEGHAMTVEDKAITYKNGLDLSVKDEVRDYVCHQIECPTHFTVDEIKLDGRQIAAVHVSLHYALNWEAL